jgi:hypothetical protein
MEVGLPSRRTPNHEQGRRRQICISALPEDLQLAHRRGVRRQPCRRHTPRAARSTAIGAGAVAVRAREAAVGGGGIARSTLGEVEAVAPARPRRRHAAASSGRSRAGWCLLCRKQGERGGRIRWRRLCHPAPRQRNQRREGVAQFGGGEGVEEREWEGGWVGIKKLCVGLRGEV